MKLYEFSTYWQHIADRSPGPFLRHNTDIRQKIPLQNSFSPSIVNPSVTSF
ncbi:MAG: hypothetical protein LH628_24995 [Microcoleus sp. CAN_BIN18]|nr:hypothetical protein [Microcoleus sp. CAN_BIN18]